MNRLMDRAAVTASALLLLTLAACGGGGGGDRAEPAEQTTEAVSEAASTVETAQSEFGEILVDSEGMTLYMFDPDEQSGRSVCDAECMEAWPILPGPAEAGQGVDGAMLGTTQATSGETMATYNDWPLYYWAQDQQPGDVTGQAVNDVWWVVGPDGKPIRETPQGGGGG